MLRKTFKYRIYPTKSQITNINNQLSMCRYLYNWNLEEKISLYKTEKKSISCYDQINKLPELKKKKPWFKSVHSQVLQDVLKRLDTAFQAFFRGLKEHSDIGFPKFKKKGELNSITYPQYYDKPKDNKVYLPKIGDINLKYHRSIPDECKVKTLSLTKDGDKYFVCFSVEYSFNAEPKQISINNILGIDLGLISFYVDSNNEEVFVPKFFRKSEDKLVKLQQKLSKTEKGTNKFFKLLNSVRNCHYKIRNQRNDFLHKTANFLLSKADCIVLEDLNIKNMIRKCKPKQDESGKFLSNGQSRKSGLNKSISDVGWYKFMSILQYKSEFLGKKIVKINPKNTSKICNQCGNIVEKTLSIRVHKCENCGLEIGRDYNSALNILSLGKQTLCLNH